MNKEGRHFILEHCFRVTNMDVGESLKSPVKKFFGVPWSLYIKREDEDYTFVSVRCELRKGTEWSINYECSVDVGPKDTHKTLKNKKFRFKASHKSRVAGFRLSGMRWSSFLGPNGYVTSTGLPVKFHITVRRMSGMKPILKAFDETNIQFSNATVEVEETNFYVDKFILKTHSPFFFKQFPVQLEEGSIPSLKLHDVASDVFQDFLELIYNESGVIQEHNVEALLMLAERLEASVVFKPCEDFLIASEMDLPEKFRLANRFNLLELGYSVLERIDSLPLLKDLLEEDISRMNQELRIGLIKRFMEEPPLLHNKVASAVVVVE